MAFAETAHLVTQLDVTGNFAPALANAQRQLSATNAAAGGAGKGLLGLSGVSGLVGRGLSGIGRLAGVASEAFATFRQRIGQLAGIAGIGGLGIGLLSLGGLIGGSISQIRDFAGEVLALKGFAKLTTEQASSLAAVFEHFGIEADSAGRLVGMAERNLFKYAGTAKAAEAFQAKYGLALRDSSGHIKDVNTLILDAADYYNRNGNAAQRAAALSALFGRNFQALVPVLSRGRAGLSAVEEEARRLGLTLNDTNLKDFQKYREATRTWGTALAGLKVQLGADILPLLTRLATGATAFVANNRTRIIGFVNSLIAYGTAIAGTVARIVNQDVIPAIRGVIGFWNQLPAPLRSILGRTVGGSLTIRFLTGIDPIGLAGAGLAKIGTAIAGAIAGSLIVKLGGFFGGIFGQVVANKAIPQVIVGTAAGVVPVFVTNPGFGGPGGIGDLIGKGAPVAGAGGLFAGVSIASIAAAAVAGLGLIVGGGILLGYLGGFKNRGPTATSTGAPGGLSVGPKGQIRPAGTANDPIHVFQTEASIERQAAASEPIRSGLANVAHGYMQLAGKLPGSAITQSKPPAVLTPEQFLARLRTTAFIGTTDYKSIFERFTTFRGGGRGTDPTGQGFLRLVEQLRNPKAPAVMFEIRGHLKELQSLEAYYIAHGDTTNAVKVQGVINEVRRLIGITQRDDAATRAEHQKVGQAVREHKLVSSAGFRALDAETRGLTATTAQGNRNTSAGLGNVAGEVRRKKLSATANVHVINQNNISTYVQLAAAAVAYQVNLVRTSTKASNILHIL